MKALKVLIPFAVLGFVVWLASVAHSAEPVAQHALLLHGWHGSASNWQNAAAAYEATGVDAHALSLPRSGDRAGDTRVNADFVEDYITDNDLEDVLVDGHSLGGTLVYELIRVRRNPAIVAAVTRDSNIQSPTGDTGFFCWFVPDQCQSSPTRQAILAAPLADVPVLNLNTSGSHLPDVDCQRTYSIDHNAFLTDTRVIADTVRWAQADNPCVAVASTSTPVTTATPSATSTPTRTPSPTATIGASPTPTRTPAPTSTPTSCPWWAWWC